MSTYFPKAGEIQKKWYVINAEGQILGRLATFVAKVLWGKQNQFIQHTKMLVILLS